MEYLNYVNAVAILVSIILMFRYRNSTSPLVRASRKLKLTGVFILWCLICEGIVLIFDYEKTGKFMVPFIIIVTIPLLIYFLKVWFEYRKLKISNY